MWKTRVHTWNRLRSAVAFSPRTLSSAVRKARRRSSASFAGSGPFWRTLTTADWKTRAGDPDVPHKGPPRTIGGNLFGPSGWNSIQTPVDVFFCLIWGRLLVGPCFFLAFYSGGVYVPTGGGVSCSQPCGPKTVERLFGLSWGI